MAVMVCWSLWKNRNNVVWNNQCWSSSQIRSIAGNIASQWMATKSHRVVQQRVSIFPAQQPVACLEKTGSGMLKLNVDATLFSQGGVVGCGCVLRDSMGLFISARAPTARVKLQSHEVEAFKCT